LTADPILQKARKYCVYQERNQQEVRDKLYEWGLHRREVEQAISQLISENYLNEQRFATAFAGGRFRIKQWGRIKIKMALQQKKVSERCIQEALNELNDRDYQKVLKKIISDKSRLLKEPNPIKKNYKIAQYAMSRGYEPELVWGILKD
jgi:regulatory protein